MEIIKKILYIFKLILEQHHEMERHINEKYK